MYPVQGWITLYVIVMMEASPALPLSNADSSSQLGSHVFFSTYLVMFLPVFCNTDCTSYPFVFSSSLKFIYSLKGI